LGAVLASLVARHHADSSALSFWSQALFILLRLDQMMPAHLTDVSQLLPHFVSSLLLLCDDLRTFHSGLFWLLCPPQVSSLVWHPQVPESAPFLRHIFLLWVTSSECCVGDGNWVASYSIENSRAR
jgi:hypothetical protein